VVCKCNEFYEPIYKNTSYSGLFKIIKAAITPGIQPAKVRRKVIKKEPQPLSITAKGGKKIARSTRIKLIDLFLGILII